MRAVRLRQLRTVSGLILFVFLLTHLINHALGLVSLSAMEAFQGLRLTVTRSTAGTVILAAALCIHAGLALIRLAAMRTWRIGLWEAVQLVSGLLIPLLLLRHIIGTRLASALFGARNDYGDLLWVLWPGEAWTQLVLITLAWGHGCIGLHFWLRLKSWYRAWLYLLYPLAVLVPAAAYAGFAVAGREVRVEGLQLPYLPAEAYTRIAGLMGASIWFWLGLLVFVLLVRLCARWLDLMRVRVRVDYVGGPSIVTAGGATLLEISRQFGVPHASACGGRARCSTCRVRVLEGLDQMDAPDEAEQRVLTRIGAGSAVRLACQIRPVGSLKVSALVPTGAGGAIAHGDRYNWGVEQVVTVMFADMRGFTALSQNSLPFDVVFMLNQYLARMSEAITAHGGYVDKFMGDGIMALFGMDAAAPGGARQALRAAMAMGVALDALNGELASSLERKLDMGIGLHTGSAILGRIGSASQAGGDRRITALGDTVNTASRLEAACKTHRAQLIVSADTLAGLNDPRAMGAVGAFRREIELRGRSGTLAAYVFARTSALDALFSGADG